MNPETEDMNSGSTYLPSLLSAKTHNLAHYEAESGLLCFEGGDTLTSAQLCVQGQAHSQCGTVVVGHFLV